MSKFPPKNKAKIRRREKSSATPDLTQVRYMYQGQTGFDASKTIKPVKAIESDKEKPGLPFSPWAEEEPIEAAQPTIEHVEDSKAKRVLTVILTIAAAATFSIVLLLVCLGLSLALVAFEPLNLQIVALTHADNTAEVVQAYQNVASDTLRYVSTLPIEDPPVLRPSADDLVVLHLAPFTKNELCHLTDVRILLGNSLLLTWILSFVALIVITVFRKMQFVRYSLTVAGIACLALPIAGAAALYFTFDPVFKFFHEVFFPQGNWQFPETSLVISTLPEPYWQTIGLLWMGFFLAGGLILLTLSRFCGKIGALSVTSD